MDNGEGGVKINGIRQIVRLKEIIHKWHSVSLSASVNGQHSIPRGFSSVISERLKSPSMMCDSDDEGCQSPNPPPDVPKGFLAVYVGKEIPLRRFIIPTIYLCHHLFKLLLKKAEEEYGFDHGGGLNIPCEIETFKYLLKCIEAENQVKGEHSDNLDSERDSAEVSSCPED